MVRALKIVLSERVERADDKGEERGGELDGKG